MKNTKDGRKTIILYLFLIFLVSLIEVFIFNLSSIRTLRGGKGIELTDRFSISDEVFQNETDDGYRAMAEEFTLYVSEVNADIKNLYIDIDFADLVVESSIYLTDEGNSVPYKLPEHFLLRERGNEDSRFITLHPYGKVKTIKMVFRVTPGESFYINQIAMNVSKPFDIKVTRLAAIYSIFVLLALFRKNGSLHQIAFCSDSKKQLVVGVLIMTLFILAAFGARNTNLEYWRGMANGQYYELTRALSKGEFSMSYPVDQRLMDLENPYDLNSWGDIKVQWDTAFYNGKYYSYFGIVPVILLYLPCYLLTGTMVEDYAVCSVFSVLMIMGSFYLIRQVLNKWGNGRVPYFAWPLLSALLCFSENYFFLYMRPYFYNIPIIAANALTVWGLGLWIKGMVADKRRWFYYFMGSLCMALVAGCRPQMVLISILAVPIFWNTVIRNRELLSKNSLMETIAICIPYIVVAAFLMYYNYTRFGSVLEFGAKYNMTTNDMTRRGVNLDRLGTGVFTFLFQPPSVISTFPYIREAVISSRYMGKSIIEFVFGGIFMTNLITLLSCLIGFYRDVLKKYRILSIVLTSLGLVVVLSCIDATIAGILQRYTADMVFVALFPACMICCVLLSEFWREKNKSYYMLSGFMVMAFVLMAGFDFFMMFSNTGAMTMEGSNPELYFYIQTFFGNI